MNVLPLRSPFRDPSQGSEPPAAGQVKVFSHSNQRLLSAYKACKLRRGWPHSNMAEPSRALELLHPSGPPPKDGQPPQLLWPRGSFLCRLWRKHMSSLEGAGRKSQAKESAITDIGSLTTAIGIGRYHSVNRDRIWKDHTFLRT